MKEEKWIKSTYSNNAGFGVRLMAWIIDVVVFIPIILILYLISWLGKINIPTETDTILFILYRIIFHYKFGATFGKKQTELHVENNEGKRINLLQSFLHESILTISMVITFVISQIQFSSITKIYSSDSGSATFSFTRSNNDWIYYLSIFATLILLIDVLWILTNKRKRSLHDIIANTYCKKK